MKVHHAATDRAPDVQALAVVLGDQLDGVKENDMADRLHWVICAALTVALVIVAIAQTLLIRPAAAQPPAPLAGGMWPMEPLPPVLPVDDLWPAFQEGFAEGVAGSAAAVGGSLAAGTLPASDNFSDPNIGLLPRASSRPDRWRIGYVSGEYQIASVGPVLDAAESVLVSGAYSDVTIAADARVIQSSEANPDETVRLYCRRQPSGAGFTGYRFQYSPPLNAFALYRGDGDRGVSLTNVQYIITPPPVASQTHRLGLTCAGSTISASIDGKQVASVQDGSYRSGSAALGVGNFTRMDLAGLLEPGSAYLGTFDARFAALALNPP